MDTEGDSSASRSRGWMLDDIESRDMVEVGLLVEAGLDGDVGSFAEYASGLLALALEALDISLSVFGDRYAESSTVFCGTAVDLGDMLPSGGPGLEREWSGGMIETAARPYIENV
ncbi:hypothetical protein BASA81_016669 [Batrachochytrium salamandrivorans]|nr:hypothetical protein BASA81_016669 [Batrachochytrium salamandrivorans]